MRHEYDVALTTYCQAKCRSCHRTNSTTGNKVDWLKLQHMDLEFYKKVLHGYIQSKEKSDIGILFCGEYGDPMMHPKIKSIIRYTAPRVSEILIKTNGGLRQPEFYRDIALGYPTVGIHFGIDGIDAETNEKYREGVNFDRAMANMKEWCKIAPNRARWDFLIFEWNWHQIPIAYQQAKELGCDIEFKINARPWGLISDKNRLIAEEMLKDLNI